MNESGSSPHASALARLRETLLKTFRFNRLDQAQTLIQSLSPGDRVIFYTLAFLLTVSSLAGLYALQQSILETVPAYGGKLIEGEIGSPRFINPLLAISDADRDLTVLTYAGLMGLSGTGSLVPVLAERYTISSDGKIYTFHLRKDATFSDGTPVTAHDVVFTINKAQNPALKSPEYANWSGILVAAIDSHTVQFTLSKPYAPFLGLTTIGILPSGIWKKITDEEFPFSTLQTNPLGAGPFVVSDISRDSTGLIRSVTLSANPSYVLGRPYLDTIRFDFYARGEDLERSLARREIESAPFLSTPGALSAPYARVFGIFWNPNENQVYTRTEVRKALSLAINRNSILENVLGGSGTAILGPVPPGGKVRQVPYREPQNPTAEAAKILTAGGWHYDGTERVWKNTTAKQTLDEITLRTSNVPELKNVASLVKNDWEKLGIKVAIELYESGDLSQNVIRPRKYEALLYGMVIGRDQDLYAFWSSKERNDPGLNIALYANKTVDALLESARTSTDVGARTANLQEVQRIIAEEYPAAFLYAPDFSYTIPNDLKGVVLPQIITPGDRFATVATWYRVTDAVWPFLAK